VAQEVAVLLLQQAEGHGGMVVLQDGQVVVDQGQVRLLVRLPGVVLAAVADVVAEGGEEGGENVDGVEQLRCGAVRCGAVR
jgi:hypothetical protein